MANVTFNTFSSASILLICLNLALTHSVSLEDKVVDYKTQETSQDDDDLTIDDVIKHFGSSTNNNFLPNAEYIAGDMNLVLAAPHAGYKEPKFIPDRDAGCFQYGACVYNHKCSPKDYTRCRAVTEHDDMTRELTFLLAYEIQKGIGKSPHMVINNLARKKLDANRERHQATFNEPYAVFAYEKYHSDIEKAKSSFDGPGLFLDIHGQSHVIQRTDFGYQISGKDLDMGEIHSFNSSIRALANRVKISLDELVRGPQSIGGLLAKRGFRAIPSPDDPSPKGQPYFSGQYDIYEHGSRLGGVIDGIMAESARDFRKPEVIRQYAKAFAGAIIEFMQLYYNLEIPVEVPKVSIKQVDAADKRNLQTAEDDQPQLKLTSQTVHNKPILSTIQDSEVSEVKISQPYTRFPVILSAGLFATVISIVMIVGAVWWKGKQRSRPSGYVTLNGEQFSFSVDSD